ncbi:MAG: UDP-N-acetylmuramoyl-L-alanine--D-glutamate ligase [Patescibacteria group bacterium]|nr:UDP-N-acetylmuramoyl-L-alanine--D-glutamate ligase [Patescibacteria group bacterium]
MEIKDLKDKLVAVLGFGQEGRSVTEYLIKHGIKPVLFDQKPWEEWSSEEKEYIRSLKINFIFGTGYLQELKGFDVAFRSPGIRLHDIAQAIGLPSRSEATGLHYTSHNIAITSQTKWFFQHCPAKIIGVTGTKGKGTTASLIYEMLSVSLRGAASAFSKATKQFLPLDVKIISSAHDDIANNAPPRNDTRGGAYLTGNIGKTQPLEILDNLNPDDWVVYELSSFQLQDLKRSPHIGVVLMVTQEHLDYHQNAVEYREAKAPIAKFQSAGDFAVINADYQESLKIGEQGKGQKYYFSREKEVEKGCYVKNGQIIVKGIGESNFQYPISNIQLRGRHNLENICAAAAASALAGVDTNSIKSALQNFKGLEHRLEFVAEKNGIKFYNDSFSTTPETAIAAINSFSEPLVVILGGSSKFADFTDLGRTIAETKNIKALVLTGQEAGRIKEAIFKAGKALPKIMEGAANMKGIFTQALSAAQKGDVVLLSPACASFGMFKNYKDRGEQFKRFAESLQNTD